MRSKLHAKMGKHRVQTGSTQRTNSAPNANAEQREGGRTVGKSLHLFPNSFRCGAMI